MVNEYKNELITILVNSRGAELKSLLLGNRQYIWSGSPKYWNRSAPVLFPIVGTLKDKQTNINGVTYPIMQHGFLRDLEFEYLGLINDEETYVNEYNSESLGLYPFKYRVYIKYKLKNLKVITTFVVENIDEVDMPFNIGGHPGIMCPIYSNDKFSDYRICFEKGETFDSPKVMSNATLDFSTSVLHFDDLKELELNKEMFSIDTIIIPEVKSSWVKLLNKENKGILFSFNNFKTFAIWTPFNDAPFVCLEPWQGNNDHHDADGLYIHKDNIITLKPNQKYVASYMIEIIE